MVEDTRKLGTVKVLMVKGQDGESTPIATTSVAGKVKPDGSTITVTSDGTISAAADGGKADKVSGATAGDLAGLNASGNLTDSGIAASSVVTTASLPLSTANGGTGNTEGYIRTGAASGSTIGTKATAEGVSTTASGSYAHAEGESTTASGNDSHAEGGVTIASGDASHAEGYETTASGHYSHAGGIHTVAGYERQTVIGEYNSNKSTTLFEVGNGTSSSAKSNAFEVYSDGKFSQDNGSTKFKFGNNGSADGYYDASGTFHAFCSGGLATTIIDLSESNVVMDESITDTVTVSYNGGGNATFTSSDTSVATVEVTSASSTGNGKTYVITITGKKEGACSIECDVPANSSYSGAKAYINVTVATSIYGAEWDGSSSPAWTRTDMATGFTDPVPYYSGMSGTPSSPFDDIMPWAGLRRVEDSEAGSLVEIPKFYYKWTRSGAKMKLQISMKPFTGCHVAPAFADRGDGAGERDKVYVGRYHCATSTYKSTTGVKPANNYTRSSFRSSIHNLGSDIWQYDFAMYWTIMMLYLVEFADWNSQAKIGYGCGNDSAAENAGLTDAMQYHTGTNAANRTTYGHVQYRYIEDLWANIYDWVDGIYFSGSSVYCIKNPASFSDSTGGTNVGTRATSSNYISAWTNPSASGFEYALYPSAVSGSESTYVCDYCYYYASGVVLCAGGGYYQSQYQARGAFYLYGYDAASYALNSIGSRLMVLPANRLPS